MNKTANKAVRRILSRYGVIDQIVATNRMDPPCIRLSVIIERLRKDKDNPMEIATVRQPGKQWMKYYLKSHYNFKSVDKKLIYHE